VLWVKENVKMKVVVKTDNKGIGNLVNFGLRINDPLVRGIISISNGDTTFGIIHH
jgi:hypothetical protein